MEAMDDAVKNCPTTAARDRAGSTDLAVTDHSELLGTTFGG